LAEEEEEEVRLIDKLIKQKSRSEKFYLYVLGDTHIGARNCAESYLRRLIRKIQDEPNALWLGGGDYIDAIKPQDSRRFTPEALPDWILEGDADTVRARLLDIVRQERDRFWLMVEPIKDKCLGLIRGNHESALTKHYNEDPHEWLCEALEVPDLTDCSFVRLRFRRQKAIQTIVVFICHGFGGGRSAGAEPNHLSRLAASKDADLVLRGHSHTFHILPPIVKLGVPRQGQLPEECYARYTRAGNWGAWLRSYAAGKQTYDSAACYPPRSLSTLEIILEPHKGLQHGNANCGRISMRECVL
jgi:predicted phosphodiesterase